jgi:hypothetical protein
MQTVLPAAYAKRTEGGGRLRRVLFENGLSIVLLFAFLMLLVAQTWTGWNSYNQEQREHGRAAVTLGNYLTSGHFVEATAENWESEFLQMGAFVWLTVFLYQKGSPESRSIDEDNPEDREPDPNKPDAPWPVKRGGWTLKLYSHSLTLAFLFMFIVSFFLHAAGGARNYSEEQTAHGEAAVSMLQYMGTSQFWFESMQNWQSEFLAIAAMVYLAVYLRQKGSPESKPVDAAHSEHE